MPPTFSLTGSEWLLAGAIGIAAGCAVALFMLRDHDEPGTPNPQIELDVTPITDEPPLHALTKCPHDVPLSRHCPICDDVLRGKHITLDGEDEPTSEKPRVPPPPPVGPKGAA